jgi:hypothetical protein
VATEELPPRARFVLFPLPTPMPSLRGAGATVGELLDRVARTPAVCSSLAIDMHLAKVKLPPVGRSNEEAKSDGSHRRIAPRRDLALDEVELRLRCDLTSNRIRDCPKTAPIHGRHQLHQLWLRRQSIISAESTSCEPRSRGLRAASG